MTLHGITHAENIGTARVKEKRQLASVTLDGPPYGNCVSRAITAHH